MAIRRMFSLQIADTDNFIEMSPEAQTLYFHLALRADDDGFVSGPKRVARMVGADDGALDELVAKRFTIGFPSGVVVIKHWHIHNTVRKDRYTPTQWQKEFAQLHKDEKTGKYQLLSEHPEIGQPNGNQMATQVRLGKVRIGKHKTTPAKAVVKKVVNKSTTSVEKTPEETAEEKQISEVIKLFETHGVNAGASRWYKIKAQREACRLLIKQFGFPLVAKVITILPQTNSLPSYQCPSATTPMQLLDKWHLIEAKLRGKQMISAGGNGKGKAIEV